MSTNAIPEFDFENPVTFAKIISILLLVIAFFFKKLIPDAIITASREYIIKFVRKTKQQKHDFALLTNHQLFDSIESLIKNNLPAIRYSCETRRAVFNDMITVFLRTLKNESENIAIKFYKPSITDENVKTLLLNYIPNTRGKWLTECRTLGIPEFALLQFDDELNKVLSYIKNIIETILSSQIIYPTNYHKVATVFSIINGLLATFLNAIEITCNSINGKFATVIYKNTTCNKNIKEDYVV